LQALSSHICFCCDDFVGCLVTAISSGFLTFSQGQGFIPEEEWEGFLATLKENLPVTFRITGTRSLAMHVLACLQRKFFVELEGLEVEGEKLPAPSLLPW
jgi:hypothetical protein